MTTIPVDSVELKSIDGDLRLVAMLGDGLPQQTGGVGGWEVVPIPGRRPILVWRGMADPLTLALPLVLDGPFAKGKSVEGRIRTLEVMAGLDVGDPEPPELTVDGAMTFRVHGTRWVIGGLEWGEGIRRPSDGYRMRQLVTVTLLRVAADDRLEHIRRPKAKPKYRLAHVHKGDTWERIASRELKLKRAGNRLARLNGVRGDASAKVKKTKVRLPTATELKKWKRELGGH